jgi:hypothetical protein
MLTADVSPWPNYSLVPQRSSSVPSTGEGVGEADLADTEDVLDGVVLVVGFVDP